MHAITISGYGPPASVLHPAEILEPTIAPDHVLVKVEAASVNPADWHIIRGIPRIARLSVGLLRPGFRVPGSDFAGVVEAIGSAVSTFRPGDRVYGTTFMTGFGAFAEKVAVPESRLAVRPANLTSGEAAAVPLAASTALQAIRDHRHTQAGDKVLIIGASGGVGSYAVQLAKHLGADVTGVTSSANLDLARSLGAHRVVDYTTSDITQLPERYDLIVQLAGTHRASQLRPLLTQGGALLQLSGDSKNKWVGPIGRVIGGRLGAMRTRQTVTTFTVQPNRDDLTYLADLLKTGALRTHIDRSFSIDHVVAAIERVESGRPRGKVTIRVAAPSDQSQVNTRRAEESPLSIGAEV